MKKISLKRELIFSLSIKFFLLWLIWWACFSHPLDHSLSLNQLQSHLVSIPASSNQSQSLEILHD